MADDENNAPQESNILDGLEARLKSHAESLNSLLALTPAREYYGSHFVDGRDPSEQWNRKKQTKEEERAAKKAKLDPKNEKSALDVMKEREAEVLRKRKREAGEGFEEDEVKQVGKKQKKGDATVDSQSEEAKRQLKAVRRKEKRLKKKEKGAEKKAKAEAKKARKQDLDLEEAEAERSNEKSRGNGGGSVESDEEHHDVEHTAELEKLDLPGFGGGDDNDAEDQEDEAAAVSSAPTTPLIESPAFDLATNHSAPSSSSSISPPSIHDQQPPPTSQRRPRSTQTDLALDILNTTTESAAETSNSVDKRNDRTVGTATPKIQLPNIDSEALHARLQAKIAAARAARKADGADGKPVKSRADLVEQRKQKKEQRKANKKAQRQKAKEDEERKREEQLRGSGSPLTRAGGGDVFDPPPRQNNYAFSKLAFEDGTSTDPSLTSLNAAQGKRKGPQDPKTALASAQAKESRLLHMNSTKQARHQENSMWSSATSRAAGDRVRTDDTSLLKKALKRKEKQKGKSEKEWQERNEGVAKAQAMKQKKREANLQKRREEKGGGGKKKKAGGKPPPKKKGRPGFEGRFKA